MEKALEEKIGFESDLDRQIAENEKDIPGWGVDADPQNNPTYPMKKWNGADHERLNYERPPMQPATVEILRSIERPTLTSVHGDTLPPKGLSGAIRRFAFKYSESTYMHWFPLVVADRVNVIEGIVDDIKNGHFPNLIQERGWAAEWKYNRKGLIKNVAIGAAVTLGIIMLIKNNKKEYKIDRKTGKVKKETSLPKPSLNNG
jgi:hypothetical protein